MIERGTGAERQHDGNDHHDEAVKETHQGRDNCDEESCDAEDDRDFKNSGDED